SSPSRRERTERTWMRARVMETSIGLSWPLRMILSLIFEFSGPRIFSTAWLRVSPCTGSSSRGVVMFLGMMPALAPRRSSGRGHDLDKPVLHGDLDAEAAELAPGLHLHVAEALGIHIARVRIESGQHAVDRRFDQLAVVGLFHVVGPHALEHVAEQAELAIGI